MPSGACEPPWPPFWPPGMSLLQSVLQCCCLSAVPWRDCSCCGCAVVRRWTVRTALHQRPGVPEPQQLPGAGRQRSSGRDAVPDRYFLGTFSMRCLSCVDFLIWGRDSHSLHLSRAQFWQHVAWGRRGILRKKSKIFAGLHCCVLLPATVASPVLPHAGQALIHRDTARRADVTEDRVSRRSQRRGHHQPQTSFAAPSPGCECAPLSE